MKYIQVPAEFTRRALRQRARHRQADLLQSFDERGRLWVIETVDYPNKRAERRSRATIASRFSRIRTATVAPTSSRSSPITSTFRRASTFANGGVIVSQAPHILFLKDTNGDDKADVRAGAEHRLGHCATRTRGRRTCSTRPDNYIWGVGRLLRIQRGDERQAAAVRPGAVPLQAGRQRLRVHHRARPTTRGASGSPRRSTSFGSTANNDPSFYVAIPNRYFDGVEGLPTGSRASGRARLSERRPRSTRCIPSTPYIRQVDVHGGYTAAAGHHLYTARAFPEGVLEPRSRSSPSRRRIWSARASSRSRAPAS